MLPVAPPTLARAWFAMQALAGAAWWVGVVTLPPVRHGTLGGLDPVLVAVLDVPLFVVASALAALGVRWAVWIAAPWTALVAAGMAGYATVTGLAGWGALLMTAAAAGSVVAAVVILLGRLPTELIATGPFAFRPARSSAPAPSLLRTLGQVVVFWGLFLVVIPGVIVVVEDRWGLRVPLPASAALAVAIVGGALLVAASALGIWSAVTMAVRGGGTPLPADTAVRLVVAGPYRFVRNPMAVAGIAQGVAVGLLLGSWLVVGYALAGSLVWNRIVRPLEEADLLARFGAEFDAYRARVRCWIP